MRIKSILITYSLLLITSAANAAVTQRWTVETSRVQPVVFEAIHGETLALEASFQSYGTGVSTSNMTAFLCWQTNGMANAWWVTNAVTSGHSASVLFTPSMDPGVPVVNAYLGLSESTNNQLPSTLYPLPSISYRAAFRLRFRHGPGERPNTITGPVPILDLAHTTVINPPWPTEADFAATTTVMKAELKGYVDDQIEGAGLVTPQSVTNASAVVTSNVVTKAYVEGLGVSGNVQSINGKTGTVILAASDVGAVSSNGGVIKGSISLYNESSSPYKKYDIRTSGDIYAGYSPSWRRINSGSIFASSLNLKDEYDSDSGYWTDLHINPSGFIYIDGGTAVNERREHSISLPITPGINENLTLAKRTDIADWARSGNAAPTSMPDNGLVLTNDAVKTKGGTAITAAHVGAADAATVNQMGQALTAVSGHLNAEDARFVSTNYDSVVRMPEAYVEIKINNNWQTIWKEMTRWGKWLWGGTGETVGTWWDGWVGFHAWSTNITEQLATKAERCWGIYDSETGEISPDGYTQISSSNILIAANMSYKRVVDTSNAIWVLESNSGLATLGGTNGYFRVKDGDGNTQFEIVKGNLRELGCDAGGTTVDDEGATPVLTIHYSVAEDSHPTLKICTDLTTADWKAESDATCAATVSWSGSSGAYVATVTAKSNSSKMFVKATYMGGSETIIRQLAPVEMANMKLKGTTHTLGVGTIGQNKLLSLNGDCVIDIGGGGVGTPLSGRTYDFDGGTDFTYRLYVTLTNVIQTLGGTVSNPPTFN